MNCRPIFDSWYCAPGLEEGVGVALEQRHVGVHAGARVTGEGLRHERRVHALLDRDLFDHGAERHDVVGRGEGVGVAQVDLVLAGARLVVAELDGDAEVFEHPHRTATEVVRRASRHVVEVAGRVDRLRSVDAVARALEQVELDLGVGVEGEAAVGGLRERALEHVARVGNRRLTVRRGDVAEHAGGGIDLATPGQDLERGGVRMREHVGLVRAGESLDRRPVETESFGECALHLGRRDRDRFEGSDHVGEPESDELDAPLFDGAKNEVALLVHGLLFSPTGAIPRRH